jgi:hypothetical protein
MKPPATERLGKILAVARKMSHFSWSARAEASQHACTSRNFCVSDCEHLIDATVGGVRRSQQTRSRTHAPRRPLGGTMSLVDALARIQQIQAQLAPLQGGTTAVAPAIAASAPAPVAAASATSFASALTQAQAPAAAQPAALSPRAAQLMTPGQQRFATQLAAQTGLDPQVIAAWMLAEESGGAAASRERQGNNDWLNIGWTDSGRHGTADAVWSDPISAANATAGWLRGQDTIPGYGTASAGVQSILATAGQPPEAQIAALQRSGWASSGYPDLPGVYRTVAG